MANTEQVGTGRSRAPRALATRRSPLYRGPRCECGIEMDACAREYDVDGSTDAHDERLARLCPSCEVHVTCDISVDARIECTNQDCGAPLMVRQHELVMIVDCDDGCPGVPEDELTLVERIDEDDAVYIAHLCSDCAEREQAQRRRQRARAAYEAWCDDRGDEMRAGGGR